MKKSTKARRALCRVPWRWVVGVALALSGGAGGWIPALWAQDLAGRPTTLEIAGGGDVDRTLDEDILPPGDPWARFRYAVSDEDQPLTTNTVSLEGGLWILPWLSTEVETGWLDADAGALEERALFVRAGLGARWDLLDLEGAIWGGGFRRARVERGDWSGGAAVRYAGPAGLSLEVGSERNLYLGTRASLTDSLTATLFEGRIVRRNAHGWAGRVSFTDALLSNDNRVHDARAWVLAPLLRRERVGIRAGYSLRAADSDESSFAPTDPRIWDEEGRLQGAYSAAYTPEEVVSHSALVHVWYDGPGGLELHLDGSRALYAREDHPILVPEYRGAPDVDLQYERRRFTPWSVRADARFQVRAGWEVGLGGGYRRSAFQEGGFAELGSTLFSPR